MSNMLLFLSACWKEVRDVFPAADLKGCSFHWAQAVLRKIDSLGLRTTYRKRQGWHRRINSRAKRTNLPFYILVPLLLEEGNLVDLQMRLVGEALLARQQSTTYRRIQGKVFELWDRLDDREITTSNFLRAVGKIYTPATERHVEIS